MRPEPGSGGPQASACPRGPQASACPRGPQASTCPRGPQASACPRGPQASACPRGPQAAACPRGPQASTCPHILRPHSQPSPLPRPPGLPKDGVPRGRQRNRIHRPHSVTAAVTQLGPPVPQASGPPPLPAGPILHPSPKDTWPFRPPPKSLRVVRGMSEDGSRLRSGRDAEGGGQMTPEGGGQMTPEGVWAPRAAIRSPQAAGQISGSRETGGGDLRIPGHSPTEKAGGQSSGLQAGLLPPLSWTCSPGVLALPRGCRTPNTCRPSHWFAPHPHGQVGALWVPCKDQEHASSLLPTPPQDCLLSFLGGRPSPGFPDDPPGLGR
ncbi:proline-rich protein 2-like [Antechinus flavipes]|uniref:proline-rich protein 2-like n=1 Tax=Antechinus flavipes TaxID=38775 RepID=UPI002235AABF|nr:proline-rich protein 2-like [Antechinus flavipes]